MTRSLLWALLPIFFASPASAADDLGLRVPPGFRVTQWSDEALANDIYAMTLDAQGRVVVTSQGWVKRLEDTHGRGKADKATVILPTKTGGMGMCFDGDDLYFVGDGWLSRYRFPPGQPPQQQKLIPLKFAEHGGHAVRKGPDGWIYVIAGNDGGVTEKFITAARSPVTKPEAGCLLRLTPDGKKCQIVAHGFRNPYDFDFNERGDIFTYDSDCEADYLLPWYAPTRLFHVAVGGHHGWRLPGSVRSFPRKDYYCDTVNILAPLGRGSPTGVVCYRHYQFPKKYRGGLFLCDWTFGKIWFCPLTPDEHSYRTKPEVFLESTGTNGFAPTDIVVAPDGSLFVSIGGRRTRGAVYHIEYVGKDAARAPAAKNDLERVLYAPQPLTAWSRAKWEPIARRAASERWLARKFTDDEKRLVATIQKETVNGPYWYRMKEFVKVMSGPAQYDQSASMIGRIGTDSLSIPERLRIARSHLWPPGQPTAANALEDTLQALGQTNDPKLRLDAVRLLMLAFGDYRLHNPPVEAWTTYTLAKPPAPGPLRDRVLKALRPLLSSPLLFPPPLRGRVRVGGDGGQRLEALPPILTLPRRGGREQNKEEVRDLLNDEAARLLAMLEDDDPATLAKVAAFWIAESHPTRDFHYLAVFSRLTGPRTPELSRRTADAVLALDGKLHGLPQRIKQNWPKRLAEIVAECRKKDPRLADELLKHRDFPKPAHVLLARDLPIEQRRQAAKLFAEAAKRDADFPWSGPLLELFSVLPSAEVRPLLRAQWDNLGLRDAILLQLAKPPEVADRERFLVGLDSPQRPVIAACLAALEQLPRDESPKNFVHLLRLLRRSLGEPKEKPLRARILALLNRQSSEHFSIAEPAEVASLRSVYQPVFAWFEKGHPDLAKAVTAGRVDVAKWAELVRQVPWSQGDAGRGAALFRQRGCATCHAGTTRLGPDLTGVTSRFSRDDLFAAIYDPSRDVAPPYRVEQIETTRGELVLGLIVYQSAEGLIVQTGATTTIRLAGPDIASRRPSNRSLMPEGLLDGLPLRDLADLYRYLQTMKPGGG